MSQLASFSLVRTIECVAHAKRFVQLLSCHTLDGVLFQERLNRPRTFGPRHFERLPPRAE
jgi:hypothetical protein